MNRNVVLLLVCFCTSLIWSSCSIYEDGPGISFRSRKARVINDWTLEFAFNNETEKDVTEDFDNVSYSFYEDGTMARFTYVKNLDSTYTQLGLWDLVDNDAQIRLLYTDPPTWPDRDYWTIKRLHEKQLWIDRDIISGSDTTAFEHRFITGAAQDTTGN